MMGESLLLAALTFLVAPAAAEDHVFFPKEVRDTAAMIRADGTPVEIVELQGTRGHLDDVLSISQAAPRIRAILE